MRTLIRLALVVSVLVSAARAAHADGAADGPYRSPPPVPLLAATDASAPLPASIPAVVHRVPPSPFATARVARGPLEVRDEWLLAQVRLTLPPTGPDPLPRGAWLLSAQLNMGNDFGFNQVGPAEMPTDRRFLVDGEHYTLAFTGRYGLSSTVDVGVRVPLQYRGGGFMDSIIDAFHDATGLLDNDRPAFDKDRYRVEGRDAAFDAIAWDDDGLGLGNVEIEAHWAFLCPRRPCDLRAALVGRVGLPTGTDPFDTSGVDVGLQVVAGKQLARAWDVYGGVGGTWFSDDEVDGVVYEDFRGHAFVGLEWRPARTWSLLAQVEAATRLVTNLVEYPGESAYLHVGAKIDLSCRTRAELGFLENLAAQQGTVDFGVFFGIDVRL